MDDGDTTVKPSNATNEKEGGSGKYNKSFFQCAEIVGGGDIAV